MTCLDYAGSYAKEGEKLPTSNPTAGPGIIAIPTPDAAEMQEWMQEEVHFDMPADATGWNQNVAVKSTGMHAMKTITRTVNLPNKQVVLTATIERTFGG